MDSRTIPGVLVALVAMSCVAESGPTVDAFTVRDSAGVRVAENVISAEVPSCSISGPTVTIGDTSGREEYELYRVFGARALSDGRIVLVNQGSQELRFYDSSGEHLFSVGREGEGPGEFRDAFYLWVMAGDTIWVGDYRPWQFLVFSPEGEWLRTVRPEPPYGNPPAFMTVLAGGHALLAERAVAAAPDFSTVRRVSAVLHRPDGSLLDTLGHYALGRWGRVGDDPRGPLLYPFFEAFAWLDGSGTTWYVGHGSEPEIEVHSLESEVGPVSKVRWTTGDRTVRDSDIAARKEALEAQYADLDPAIARQLVDPLISDDRPVADRFPVFNEVVANRDGGFWVREYPRPGESDTHTWLSFDHEGRFACSVILPDVEVLDVGRDYVLVKQENEMEVEQVARFEVAEPSR